MGEQTSKIFGAEGARVAVTDYNEDNAKRVAAEIVKAGGDAKAWRLDVTNQAEIKKVVDEVAAAFGGLDALVNNAGIVMPGAIDDPSYDASWDRTFDVLLTAQQRMVRAALPYLRKSDAARIVNIASTEGLGATPLNSAYAAAKTGVIGLTRGLAVDLGKEGITVNCVCPGPINTNMTASIQDDHKVIFAKRRTALRRYGDPAEVGHITVSLCMPAASYITGAVIPVDGGLMAKNA
jgi:3-oxoacyl-[acyl-carrier protein] reductase